MFSQTLRGVILSVPYSSAASYHQFFGDGEPPLSMGRGCGWQSFTAGDLVRERTGVSATYLFSGAHVPALYFGADTITVLDPYLPHIEPIVLDKKVGVAGQAVVEVDAYPIRVAADGTPAPSKLRGTWRFADGVLRLEYIRYSPRLGGYRTFRAFTFRAGATLPSVPPPHGLVRGILRQPAQNNLSVRVVHPDDELVRELVLPFTNRPRARVVDENYLVTKDNQGAVSRLGSAGYRRDLAVIADALSVTAAEAVEFVMDAAVLYDKAAPRDIEWPEYSVEDE
ncbi:hypothetical protein [Actinokineospora xionganensis]|uniref:Uncharacterized protein n=1 Tax=Actinokineospora xionganensis TaxID=2684470 RepID=A0ABR7KZV6_9PSEU|nr:hypothetical protein [Actinokineospora xionganensis]MBC6445961.1 hypothetical protein [Actinokineospora xionganensis]